LGYEETTRAMARYHPSVGSGTQEAHCQTVRRWEAAPREPQGIKNPQKSPSGVKFPGLIALYFQTKPNGATRKKQKPKTKIIVSSSCKLKPCSIRTNNNKTPNICTRTSIFTCSRVLSEYSSINTSVTKFYNDKKSPRT